MVQGLGKEVSGGSWSGGVRWSVVNYRAHRKYEGKVIFSVCLFTTEGGGTVTPSPLHNTSNHWSRFLSGRWGVTRN